MQYIKKLPQYCKNLLIKKKKCIIKLVSVAITVKNMGSIYESFNYRQN